jgi:hypothetical protein
VQFVTPLSNPGTEKPEEKDVMIDVNPEGEHDEEMTGEQDEVPTHWEDSKEEGSRGTDIKDVLEVEMEIPEDEAEEQADDEDLGEDDGEYLIKGDAESLKRWDLGIQDPEEGSTK